MGLRERFHQIGKGFAERRRIKLARVAVREHKRAHIEKQKKELTEKKRNQGEIRQLMIDADKAVDLRSQLLSIRDFLNGHKPDGGGPWKLIEVSGLVGTQGAHGFALIRKNTGFKDTVFTKKERYSYIFVGRYFKGKEIKVGEGEEAKKHVVWDVGEESVENLTIRAGETARYYNVNSATATNRIIPTIKHLRKVIIDDSPLHVDHYVSYLADVHGATKPFSSTSRLQIAVGKVAEIKQNLKNSSWGKNKRDTIKGEAMRFMEGIETYNQRLEEGGRGIRRFHIYRG